mgnify:CR=1 FL=1
MESKVAMLISRNPHNLINDEDPRAMLVSRIYQKYNYDHNFLMIKNKEKERNLRILNQTKMRELNG